MAIINAVLENIEDRHYICVTFDPENFVKIPLSDDNANEIKAAFNKIIHRIRIGEFEIKMNEVGEDLYSQVANEYLVQLNREIKEVRGEMEARGLTSSPTPPPTTL